MEFFWKLLFAFFVVSNLYYAGKEMENKNYRMVGFQIGLAILCLVLFLTKMGFTLNVQFK